MSVLVIDRINKEIHKYDSEYSFKMNGTTILFDFEEEFLGITTNFVGDQAFHEWKSNIKTRGLSGKEMNSLYDQKFTPSPYKTGFLKRKIIRDWKFKTISDTIRLKKRETISIQLDLRKYLIIDHRKEENEISKIRLNKD